MPKHKFTLALNEKLPESLLKKATLIACASLVANASPDDINNMQFLTFQDATGAKHEAISALSLVVMKGKSSELRKFRDALQAASAVFAEVSRERLGAHPELAVEMAAIPPEQQLIAVAAFGEIAALEGATGRLSLWR